MNVLFDTLAYARPMESVGFTRSPAEAMAEEQAKLIDERLATKADLAALHANLTREIASVRTDLTREIELLRKDVLIKLGAMIIGSLAAMSTIVALIARLH